MSQFVSEAITPLFHSEEDARAKSTRAYIPGAPVLPQGFVWRKREYWIESVLVAWKETGACRSGSSESYLRKHWYRVQVADRMEMKIYFERRARSKAQSAKRWWLYTIEGEATRAPQKK